MPDEPDTYLCWVNIINELYLPNTLPQPLDTVVSIRNQFKTQEALLKKSMKEEEFSLLSGFVNNFPTLPLMSLKSGMADTEVRIRVIIAHFWIQVMQMSDAAEMLSLSSVSSKALF